MRSNTMLIRVLSPKAKSQSPLARDEHVGYMVGEVYEVSVGTGESFIRRGWAEQVVAIEAPVEFVPVEALAPAEGEPAAPAPQPAAMPQPPPPPPKAATPANGEPAVPVPPAPTPEPAADAAAAPASGEAPAPAKPPKRERKFAAKS